MSSPSVHDNGFSRALLSVRVVNIDYHMVPLSQHSKSFQAQSLFKQSLRQRSSHRTGYEHEHGHRHGHEHLNQQDHGNSLAQNQQHEQIQKHKIQERVQDQNRLVETQNDHPADVVHGLSPKKLRSRSGHPWAEKSASSVVMAPAPTAALLTSSLDLDPRVPVPVVRIFGSTPAGQTCCVHLHGAVPYFYVPVPQEVLQSRAKERAQEQEKGKGNERIQQQHSGQALAGNETENQLYALNQGARDLFMELESAMVTFFQQVQTTNMQKHHNLPETNQTTPTQRYILDITPVRKRCIYGYSPHDKYFYKISVINPTNVSKLVALCTSGHLTPTWGGFLQPYENHIPFLMQVMIDYNLVGMGYANFSSVKFRLPLPSNLIPQDSLEVSCDLISSSPSERIFNSQRIESHQHLAWDVEIPRMSRCDIEVDAFTQAILNADQGQGPESQFILTTLRAFRQHIRSSGGEPPPRELSHKPRTVLPGQNLNPLEFHELLKQLCIEREAHLRLSTHITEKNQNFQNHYENKNKNQHQNQDKPIYSHKDNASPCAIPTETQLSSMTTHTWQSLYRTRFSSPDTHDRSDTDLLAWMRKNMDHNDWKDPPETFIFKENETDWADIFDATPKENAHDKASPHDDSDWADIIDATQKENAHDKPSLHDDRTFPPSLSHDSTSTNSCSDIPQLDGATDHPKKKTSSKKVKRKFIAKPLDVTSVPLERVSENPSRAVSKKPRIRRKVFVSTYKPLHINRSSCEPEAKHNQQDSNTNLNDAKNEATSCDQEETIVSATESSVDGMSLQDEILPVPNEIMPILDEQLKIQRQQHERAHEVFSPLLQEHYDDSNEQEAKLHEDRKIRSRHLLCTNSREQDFDDFNDNTGLVYVLKVEAPSHSAVTEGLSKNPAPRQFFNQKKDKPNSVYHVAETLNTNSLKNLPRAPRIFSSKVESPENILSGNVPFALIPARNPPIVENVLAEAKLSEMKKSLKNFQSSPSNSSMLFGTNDRYASLEDPILESAMEVGEIEESFGFEQIRDKPVSPKYDESTFFECLQDTLKLPMQKYLRNASQITPGKKAAFQDANGTSGSCSSNPDRTKHIGKEKLSVESVSEYHESQGLRILAVEILADSRCGLLPDPLFDQTAAIACIFRNESDKILHGRESDKAFILTCELGGPRTEKYLNLSFGLSARHTHFETEASLYETFVGLINAFDVDIIVGFETVNNSIGYIMDRSRVIGFPFLSSASRYIEEKDQSSESRDAGNYHRDPAKLYMMRKGAGTKLTGRHIFNAWRLVRADIALQSYTIESVSFAILGKRIPYFDQSILIDWYRRGGMSACKALELKLRHVILLLEILDSIDSFGRSGELARVFGIDLFSVYLRGSQYRVESVLARSAHSKNYLLLGATRDQVYNQPAVECLPLILEPESKYYTDPVLVFDFQSLYPSMIIAHNLCFSTMIGSLKTIKKWNEPRTLGVVEKYICPDFCEFVDNKDRKSLDLPVYITPNGEGFVTSKVLRGILPQLLEEILDTRVMVKNEMLKAKDKKILRQLLNSRQFGLKMIANVTYGYTAASFSGRMPASNLADSIVQCGRQTLETTIKFVEAEYKHLNARVVYGDTDSLFVNLPGLDLSEAFKVGNEIAERVSELFPQPVKLQFEKVFKPCLLLSKKRYVGYSYESENGGAIFLAKGTEHIRRDTCPANQKILERALRILFETNDVSRARDICQRQLLRILEGRVSLQDFIFRQEVKLGSYKIGHLPPAAVVARRALERDPRSGPRYGERVAYVVAYCTPGSNLRDAVVSPEDFLLESENGTMRLNHTYYITKQIVPTLQRHFSLLGVNVQGWYDELPRPSSAPLRGKSSAGVNGSSSVVRKPRSNVTVMGHYFTSMKCVICGNLDGMKTTGPQPSGRKVKDVQSLERDVLGTGEAKTITKRIGSPRLCQNCKETSAQESMFIMWKRIGYTENKLRNLDDICSGCCGIARGNAREIPCSSLDCNVMYEKRKCVERVRLLRQAMGSPILNEKS